MGTLQKLITTGLGTAIAAKEDLSKIIARELISFLQHVNIHEELRKALAGLRVEVTATFDLHQTGASKLSARKIRLKAQTQKRKR